MIFYVVQYILVFVFSSLTMFRRKAEPYVFPIIFLTLFLFAAFRGTYIGPDYINYLMNFRKLLSTHNEYFTFKRMAIYEPSYYLIPLLAKTISAQYYSYITFAIFAFLGVYFKMRAFYLSNSFFLSIVLYFGTYFFLHEMAQIRAGVAAGIFLLSIDYIYNRQFAKYCLCILCACFFHYSAIFFLPAYFLRPGTFKKRNYSILLISACLLSLLGVNLLNPSLLTFIPKISLYLEMAEREKLYSTLKIWNSPGFLINLFVTFLLLYKSKLLETKNKYFFFMLKLNIVSILILLTLASIPVLAGRVSQLLGIIQLVLFPTLIYAFGKKPIGYLIVLMIPALYFYNYLFFAPIFRPYYAWWY
jgi:hypothetical protein